MGLELRVREVICREEVVIVVCIVTQSDLLIEIRLLTSLLVSQQSDLRWGTGAKASALPWVTQATESARQLRWRSKCTEAARTSCT